MLMRLVRLEHGQALLMALMTMVVLAIVTTGVIYYTQQSEHQSTYSRASDASYRLAESGLNNAVAVLGNTSNQSMVQSTLPSTEGTASSQSYASGTSKWWGVYTPPSGTASAYWTLYGEGVVRNPTNTGGNINRTISATVTLLPTSTQPVTNGIWNYLASTATGNTCDELIQNSITLKISLFVAGNFCSKDSSSMAPATAPPTPVVPVNLYVGGTYTSNNSSHIGASGTGNAINQAIIVGGCNGHSPCKWNGGGDPVYATTTGTSYPGTLPTVPVPNFAGMYTAASPGPKSPCTTVSGTPPVFENEVTNPTANNSVTGVFNLTPASSYTCKTSTGELSWNATTNVLTVNGTIYIDGSATTTANIAQYSGLATLYLSGTFSISNSSQFCGAVSSGSCNFAGWDPNTNMLVICAANMGNAASAIIVQNSSSFQGGLYAPTSSVITLKDSATYEGPVVGGQLSINNSVTMKPFPVLSTLPNNVPGNPTVRAQPQAPSNYSG